MQHKGRNTVELMITTGDHDEKRWQIVKNSTVTMKVESGLFKLYFSKLQDLKTHHHCHVGGSVVVQTPSAINNGAERVRPLARLVFIYFIFSVNP